MTSVSWCLVRVGPVGPVVRREPYFFGKANAIMPVGGASTPGAAGGA
jgi:hypothetical protein